MKIQKQNKIMVHPRTHATTYRPERQEVGTARKCKRFISSRCNAVPSPVIIDQVICVQRSHITWRGNSGITQIICLLYDRHHQQIIVLSGQCTHILQPGAIFACLTCVPIFDWRTYSRSSLLPSNVSTSVPT